MIIFMHLFTCMMNLSCPGPPSAPYDLTLPLVDLSAAHLNWTAPEDDGGVSDHSWDPAFDDKQNSTSLTYTVTLTNGKDTTMVTTKALSLIVSNLQHSTAYTVTVVAENVYERGPKAATVFSTGKQVIPLLYRAANFNKPSEMSIGVSNVWLTYGSSTYFHTCRSTAVCTELACRYSGS